MIHTVRNVDVDSAGVASDHAPGLLPHTRHNTQATSIGMRFFARSIGDRNPRHVVESYQSQTGGAGFVAHPCWLYSVQDTAIASGPIDTCPIIAGTNWVFHKPVTLGEKIFTVARLVREWNRTGRLAGPGLFQEVAVSYLDGRGDELATATSTILHVSPEAAQRGGKYKDWQRWRYTHEELDRIERGYDAEQVRGDRPLYHEDVDVNTELPEIVRGPVSSEEIVLFVGATRPIPGMAAFTRDLAAGRARGFIHPRTGAHESYAAGLIDDESAQQLGFPAAHDYGIDRISQMASLITNWIGDAGRLVRLDARLPEACMLGDTTWFTGRVIGKAGNADGKGTAASTTGLVHLESTGINQRGEVTVRASATVALPRRSRSNS